MNGQWQDVTLTEDPELLLQWLWAWDGKEAVCIEEKKGKKIYYCSTEQLRDKYKSGGVKAAMFVTLAEKLHDPATVDPRVSPAWCARHEVLCSEKPLCAADCRMEGGGRDETGNG